MNTSNTVVSPLIRGDAFTLSNPNYFSNLNRRLNANEKYLGIAQWFASNTFTVISKTFDESAIPYTKVYDILDVLNDPQVIARKGIID
jgi:crotonobetainyl-CoA:carnitine CoA-transferase CaiB-like acyl-CoA transferase